MGVWEGGREALCGVHSDVGSTGTPRKEGRSASPNPSVVVGDLAPKRLKRSLFLFLFFNMEMIPVT